MQLTNTPQSHLLPGEILGWKIMRRDPLSGHLISGADSRLRLSPDIGEEVHMPHPGIWMSTDREYVEAHYSVHDHEVMLGFALHPSRVCAGNLEDREPEFAVPSARLIHIEIRH